MVEEKQLKIKKLEKIEDLETLEKGSVVGVAGIGFMSYGKNIDNRIFFVGRAEESISYVDISKKEIGIKNGKLLCQKPWIKDPWHVNAIVVFDHCQNSTSSSNHSSQTSGILKFKNSCFKGAVDNKNSLFYKNWDKELSEVGF